MTDTDDLEKTWEQGEFAPPCEAHSITCPNVAVAVIVFKRTCDCYPAKPKVCEGCRRETVEHIESIPAEFRVLDCLVCRAPIEYITWYYF